MDLVRSLADVVATKLGKKKIRLSPNGGGASLYPPNRHFWVDSMHVSL